MTKFKKWLYMRFLPAYCRDDLLEKNDRLTAKLRQQAITIARLEEYIDGLEYAMRRAGRITINAKEVNKQ